jgi:hypothetical protein
MPKAILNRITLPDRSRLVIDAPNRDFYLSDKTKEAILKNITKIKPRIHRIILFGPYNNNHLSLQLKLSPPRPAGSRMPYYRNMSYSNLRNTRLSIFYNPIKNRPPCRIELTHRSVRFHVELKLMLPHLDITSVEYAVDFFCRSHDQVADLFFVFWLYLYFPRYAGIRYVGGEFKGLWEDREENVVYKVGDVNKIYERGHDNKRDGKKWDHTDVDRVRVEFTIKKHHLNKFQIENFSDFVSSPRFFNVVFDRFIFKIFDGSNTLPKEFEKARLLVPGNKAKTLNFQELVALANKHNFVNPRNYFREAAGFDGLRKAIKVAMEKYDRRWIRREKEFRLKLSPGNAGNLELID